MPIRDSFHAFLARSIPPIQPTSISLRHPQMAKHLIESWPWTPAEFRQVSTWDQSGAVFNDHLFARNENWAFRAKSCNLVAPQGLVFLQGSAVEESNYRGGGVSDAIPMMNAWPNFRQSKRRTSTNLGKLLLTNRPKFFLSASFENYYHFLLESLPKFLEVIRHMPDTLVLIPERHPEFLRKFVEKEGVDFLLVGDGSWQVSGLFVVERDPYSPLVRHEASLLSTHFLGADSGRNHDAPAAKLYVSRVGSSRALHLEELLEEYLEGIGFVILRPHDLSDVHQNARIFSRASIVIGAHGAGLANTVFSSRGTTVIELASPNWWSPAFSALAQEMGLNHKVIPLKVGGLTSHGNALEALQALKTDLYN